MSNSSLVNYTKISPNRGNYIKGVRKDGRTDTIKKITIHHMAVVNASLEAIGEAFSKPARECSSNYAIDSNGRVAMYCEEKNRSWCSGNAENDNQAITIEVSNDGGAPDWHVSDKALAKLIELCVDICKRNNIKKLNFTSDKNGNLTMHKYFQPTACPGQYLASKFSYIADEVNKKLNMPVSTETVKVPAKTSASEPMSAQSIDEGDTVRVKAKCGSFDGIPHNKLLATWYTADHIVSQLNKSNGRAVLDINGGCTAFKVSDLILIKKKGVVTPVTKPVSKPPVATPTLKPNDQVKVINAINYDNGKKFTCWFPTYIVSEVKGNRAVIGVKVLGKFVITSAIDVRNLKKV